MSSFNNIEKQIYSSNQEDIVALREYIIFTNVSSAKYVAFKFYNTVNQLLLKFKFEVLQYDKDLNLLEKEIIEYSANASANDYFIPQAKLKVNDECTSIRYRLIFARFKTVYWENNEFHKVAMSLDDYREILKRETPKPKRKQKKLLSKRQIKKATKKERKVMSKLEKKIRKHKGFYIERQFKLYRGRFRKFLVFNLSLAAIVLSYFAVVKFGEINKDVTYEGLNYVIEYKINNDQSLTLENFTGKARKVVIPKSLSGRTVKTIREGVFEGANIEYLEINADLKEIETFAFRNCVNLKEITGKGNIYSIQSSAFYGCTNLVKVSLPNVKNVNSNAFENCYRIRELNLKNANLKNKALAGLYDLEYLTFGDCDGASFYYIFGQYTSSVPKSLRTVKLNKVYISEGFLSGVSKEIKFVALNKEAVIEGSAQDYFSE